MRGAQAFSSARSGSWSVYSNWVREVRPPVRTSWVAWMKVRMPSTRSSFGRRRPITWKALASRSSRGLSVMYMRPELSAWPLPPSDMPTVATAGSAWTMAPTFSCSACIAENEMSCDASVTPIMKPVSCCGKKPFGIATNR
jgi:hypothetical protein